MIVKLLTEHHLEFLSLKRGCTGSSEYTLFKMPHCWKAHVAAHLCFFKYTISNKDYNLCFRRKNAGLRWLSNVNCSGQESYFGRCGNIRWGSIQSCADDVDAAAYCYQKSGNIKVQIIVSCDLLLTNLVVSYSAHYTYLGFKSFSRQ